MRAVGKAIADALIRTVVPFSPRRGVDGLTHRPTHLPTVRL